ncbi:glycoside hydrolase family 30 protein [Fodinibius sp. Rm-B-1B1-1]|uniref:glycoside hydrolase family 30 protein n=1 Tax=Fodinibius alkaliphilus TaxID=3140241 RepID=UPI00315AA496
MKSKIFLGLLLIFIGCDGTVKERNNSSDSESEILTLTVDFENKQQKIEGFGASDAWSTQFVGKNWPLEKRENIADYLFSTEIDSQGNPEGIGLSIWRFNIGAGSARQGNESGIGDPWRRAESFLAADSTYDWSRQQGQQWFVEAASQRGVENFIGFVNSPPILLTKNGQAYGNGGEEANISESNYEHFADYLAQIAQYFSSQGTPLSYISPVNEPQWDWSQDNGQEGSPYQNEEIDGVVKALDQKLQEYDLDSKIEIPETAQIDFLYDGDLSGRSNQTEHFFGAGSEVKNLSTIAPKMAAHSYFTTWPVADMIEHRRQVRKNIENADEPIDYWMSEYCILADNEEIQGNGRDLGIDPALYVARIIHFDLTITNAASWQWWLGVSPYDYKDGLVYIDKNIENGDIYDSKLLWGLGNYSRFIRPGSVRLGLSRSDDATAEEAAMQVMASAYVHEDKGQLTVVLVNYGNLDKEISISIKNSGDQSLSEFVPYLTSSDKNLQRQESIPINESITVPARSIMTFQADLSN